MSNPERRQGDRHSVYLAAEIFVDETNTRTAITKDISAQGSLVLTRARLSEGQPVELRVYLPGDDDRILAVSCQVVRRETLNADERGTWRDKVAVSFDEPQEQLAIEFSTLAEQQARLHRRGG